MNRLMFLVFLLLSSLTSYQQINYLFVKQGGHKKRTYAEGDRVHFVLQNGQDKKGLITLLRNDTIYINGKPIPRLQVAALILDEAHKKPFPADVKTMLAIGAGVGLVTLGLTLNDANEPKEALIAAAAIGYGPLLLKHFGGRFLFALKRKKYKIGKKFRLQVFNMYVPPRRAF